MKAKLGIAALTAALVVGSAAFVRPVHAQTSGTPPSLTLTGQDPWTPAGGTFTMHLQTNAVPEGLRLTLTVHDRLLSRSAFDATITGDNPPLGQTLTLLRLPLDDYLADASGVRVVPVDLNRLNVRRSGNGIYPIEVQLRDSDDHTLAGFVTHVVVADLSGAAPKPLGVAWVWPLVADPALGFDGSPDPAVVEQLGVTGRLGRQATLIGADADVPLTLAPSPETLDAWSTLAQDDVGLAAGVAALTSAVPHHQVLAGPFVPLDLPSIFDGGLGATLANELDRGGDALQTFFSSHFDPSTAMPGPLDTTSLDALRNAARRPRLVVDGGALEPYDGRFTPSRPALVARAPGNAADAVTVVATDPGLQRFLQGDEAPALRAAHLLAALAVIAGEQPSLARGVAFANPNTWDASDEFVNAVLTGLRQNPLLRPVTVDTLLAETPTATVDDEPDGNPVVRVLAPVRVRKPPVTASQYYDALQDRQGIAALFGESDTRVARADRMLLSSLSANLEKPAGRRRARDRLHAIGQSGRDFLSLIRIPPGQSTVTLTASKAQIPLTFRNDADREVPIHLSLASDKLLFPDGADRDISLQPGKNQTVRIAVETRSSGTFPLVMTVTTAGGLPIQTSEVTVRSSFVSGVGVFLTVGAVVFLALWWGWDIRRRRRRRQTA
ncbi:MAG: DUF6049 family protein [Acidimicrobiia bacterium]